MIRVAIGARAAAAVAVLLALLAACAPPGSGQDRTSQARRAPLLTGRVRAEDGAPLAGVTVSARLSGGPMTISVFTDAGGAYFFPPFPMRGTYVVSAQAVGYQRAQSEQALAPGVRSANFTLHPTSDYRLQLSGWQQIMGLPEETREDRRGKAIFIRACTGCHQASKVLARRFDEAGWGRVIDAMGKLTPAGTAPEVFVTHREEIAAYLARVSGPGPSILKLRPPPSPSGEVLNATIFEYDIANYQGGYALDYGSDWYKGPPVSAGSGIAIHDATVDLDGNLWFTSPAPLPGRTIGKIDGVTGATTSIAFPGDVRPEGASHAVITARDGTIWFNVFNSKVPLLSYLAMIDPRTGDRETYRVPEGMTPVGGWLTEDGNGDIWTASGSYSGPAGALRFDRKTKRFEEFRSLKDGMTYGVAGDAHGDGWWAQINTDRVYHVDRATRKVSEISVPFSWQGAAFLKAGDMTQKEYVDVVFGVGSVRGGAQMPRRMKADLKGDSVWVGNWAGNSLMRIDVRTHRLEINPAPYAAMLPYDVGVDSQHRVWVGIQNGDDIAQFDPDTKRWTIYPLPTRGVSARSLMVVERAGRVEVVVPANDANKVIRLIPGTAADSAALRRLYRDAAD